jgi:hypothetical protein
MITVAGTSAQEYHMRNLVGSAVKNRKGCMLGRNQTYLRRCHRRWLNSFVAGIIVLSQILLIVGTNTSFADTSASSRVSAPSAEFPFGPMVICTPNGIQIIYPNGDGPDGSDGEGKTWVKCPLCLIATAPFLMPPSVVGENIPDLSGATDIIWTSETERPRSIGRYFNQPVRAPPFGLSI